ncbi:MAG: transcriptional regulator with XRE-family HTH domain, partial [Paraglaciecola sp.]
MSKKIFELRYIFGLKLKELRQEKGITYQELSKRSGLSISYLSEIESGKKYPKGDKIFLLAESLSTSYDELVSLKVPKKLEPIIEVIESDFMKHFPLGEFGLNPQKVIEVVAQNPAKINAFISTIIQVSRNHELTSSKFYYAALKTYQELHDNYFEELETLVEQMHLEFTELAEVPFEPKVVEDVLLKIGVRTDMEVLGSHEELTNLRSLYHAKQRLLMLNAGLNKAQQSFLMGREIAFQWMRVKSRPLSTPPYGEYTFEEILNNYKASYFSSALLMPKRDMIPDIQAFADEKTWNRELFLRLINRYEATPEMVMQRLTNILPTYFKLKNLFFLRFLKTGGKYYLTKELHLSRQHSPHVNELNEHYCRRWMSLQVIEDLESAGSTDLVANAHFSDFIDSKSEYFIMSIAFPNISNPSESISVTIGLLNDATLKKHLNFIDQDHSIARKSVNVTCERCAEVDCTV